MLSIIQVVVSFEAPFWVAVFERSDDEGYAVSRQVFGSEPTDPELYEFITHHYFSLNFTEPQKNIKLVIKRKNFKRTSRDVRKLMAKSKQVMKQETLSQEVLRLQLEQNKKTKKCISKEQKDVQKALKFKLKQAKKKEKQKGH